MRLTQISTVATEPTTFRGNLRILSSSDDLASCLSDDRDLCELLAWFAHQSLPLSPCGKTQEMSTPFTAKGPPAVTNPRNFASMSHPMPYRRFWTTSIRRKHANLANWYHVLYFCTSASFLGAISGHLGHFFDKPGQMSYPDHVKFTPYTQKKD